MTMSTPPPTPPPTPAFPVETALFDWGSLAEWSGALVAVVAVVVGAIALRYNRRAVDASTEANKITADAYQADVTEREQAQARFVYSLVKRRGNYSAGERVQRNSFSNWSAAGPNTVFTSEERYDEYGNSETVFASDWAFVEFEVHNTSDEIVGPFAISPYARDGSREFNIRSGRTIDAPLMPGATIDSGFFIEGRLEGAIGAELQFRDSGGRWWRRRDYDPVERVDGPPPGW